VKATASARAAADRRSLAAYVELLIERDAENAVPAKKPKSPDFILRILQVFGVPFGKTSPIDP
jgi:hypothetical protein